MNYFCPKPNPMNNKPFSHLITLLLVLIFNQQIIAQENKTVNLDSLDRYINQAFADFDLHGLSVMIIQDDQIVFDKNLGTAGYNKDVSSISVYNIASCTKAFTGAAMAKLVHEDKIKWSDLVIDYLPEFKLADPYITTHLTIEDLLTHRSGLGTFYGDLLWYETNRSTKDVIERLQYLPVTNRFRNQYGYQNTMYMVAGEVLEKVSGQSWEEYIKSNILEPLKMKSTAINGSELKKKQDIAYPMIDREVIDITMEKSHAAASLFSSTQDLSMWVRMLLNNGVLDEDTIISPAIINDMMAPRFTKSVSGLRKMSGAQFSTYALGWNAWDHNGRKVVEHAGGMPGYISQVTLVPQENLGIIILTNTLTSFPTALEMYILDLYLKDKSTDWATMFLNFKKRGEKADEEELEEREKSRIADTKPSLPLKSYVGIYVDQMYGKAEVSIKAKQLQMVFLPAKEVFTANMEHWHFDTFKVKFKDPFLPAGYITFSFDSKRKIEGFKIDLKSNDFHFFNLDFKKLD